MPMKHKLRLGSRFWFRFLNVFLIPMKIVAKHLFAELREIITPAIHAQNHALAI
jgi:hypothetical protein